MPPPASRADVRVGVLSFDQFEELIGRLALRFTPPMVTLSTTPGCPASPVRFLQQFLLELDVSGGREKIQKAVRGSAGVPPIRGIGKLRAVLVAK